MLTCNEASSCLKARLEQRHCKRRHALASRIAQHGGLRRRNRHAPLAIVQLKQRFLTDRFARAALAATHPPRAGDQPRHASGEREADADALVDRINLLMTAGQLSAATVKLIADALKTTPVTAASTDNAKRDRVAAAIFLVMASAEYLIQK